jgi:hypothetical protein
MKKYADQTHIFMFWARKPLTPIFVAELFQPFEAVR